MARGKKTGGKDFGPGNPGKLPGTVNKRTLNELLYTAAETGMMDFRLSEKDAMMVACIVGLAVKLGRKVPDELRM